MKFFKKGALMKNKTFFLCVFAAFVLVVIAACDLTNENISPAINSFTASSIKIDANSSVTLNWNVKNAERVSIDNGIGNVSGEGSTSLTLSKAGVHTYTLTAVTGGIQKTASVSIVCTEVLSQASRIIDHNCLDLSRIPADFLTLAKDRILSQLAMSDIHGDQILLGLKLLFDENPFYAFIANQCKFIGIPTQLRILIGNPTITLRFTDNSEMDSLETEGNITQLPTALNNLMTLNGTTSLKTIFPSNMICEYYVPAVDYWASDRGYFWSMSTNLFRRPYNDISLWIWDSELNTASHLFVMQYLNSIMQLNFFGKLFNIEITFVLSTSPADTPNANRQERNQEIRDFCIKHNLWLFDFEDIESWYNGQQYLENGIITRDPHYADDGFGGYTNAENCRNKAIAYWWLMARLAGWNGQ
jgi:hypothetical protein